MREASPDSFLGTSCSQSDSLRRWMTRCDVDAPRVPLGLREPELRQGDSHLDRPAALPHRHGRLPDGIPGVVEEAVVVDQGVPLDARRRHGELRAGQAIVVGVEVDDQDVAVNGDVAARQLADDRPRVAVEQLGGDVERVVVVGETDARILAGRTALVRIPLEEPGDGRRDFPDGVVEAAVDLGRRSRTDRGDVAGGSGLRPSGTGADEKDEQEWGKRATTRHGVYSIVSSGLRHHFSAPWRTASGASTPPMRRRRRRRAAACRGRRR